MFEWGGDEAFPWVEVGRVVFGFVEGYIRKALYWFEGVAERTKQYLDVVVRALSFGWFSLDGGGSRGAAEGAVSGE